MQPEDPTVDVDGVQVRKAADRVEDVQASTVVYHDGCKQTDETQFILLILFRGCFKLPHCTAVADFALLLVTFELP